MFATRTLALSYLRRGQLPEAEEQFKKLIALAPDDRLGYANLGLTYLQAGRYRDAEPQLRRARDLDPTNAEVALLLAKLYSLTGRHDEARTLLQQVRDTAANARALYALAELEADGSDSASLVRYQQRLIQALAAAPANVAIRAQLIDVLARRGKPDSTLQQLEELRRLPPEPPREARPYLTSALGLLRDGKLAEARGSLSRFLDMLKATVPYQASLEEVKWAEAPLVGRPILTFAATHLVTLRGVREKATTDSVQFLDVTDEAGLFDPQSRASPRASGATSGPTALALGDVDGDNDDDVFVSFWSPERGRALAHLYFVQGGFARDMTAAAAVLLPNGAASATFADYDNDGWLDLFVIGNDARGYMLRNRGNGTFEDVTASARVARINGARTAVFVDLDHDGDLDLLLVGSDPLSVYRNNSDGSFSEAAASLGLTLGNISDAAFADLDGDGRVDLLLPNEHGVALLKGAAAQGFTDVTAASGLPQGAAVGAIAIGDCNNDGALDLFIAGTSGSPAGIWLNKGDGTFAIDPRFSGSLQSVHGVAAQAAQFVDYENDGWLDLVVAGTPRQAGQPGVLVFRNTGSGAFAERSSIVPQAMRTAGAAAVRVSDIDGDGDLDLLLTDLTGAVRLLRNEGGNSNMAVKVELKGLRSGSGKNNVFGIGARVEMRAGEIYQTRVVTSRITQFGLGPHLKADVVRVEWPNGVPQTIYLPGTDFDVVESEMLKGSCAFLYTWDGTRFNFVTDVMWRSALGMPLGLMGSSSAFAPAGASQEYLRIAGAALRPRDGRYTLQFTEELWETAYMDEIKLLAVDHPDSVEVFVDETFVPPGPVQLRLIKVVRPRPPISASDERGNDLLPALRAHDAVYVSNLTPAQYQGVVEPHDLILDLGEQAGRPGAYLFLRGWIYPTDASINVSLGQQTRLQVRPPSLEVMSHGEWVTAIPNLGFPSGKDKTMAIDLSGKFPTADHRVRIRTNMQIYWDQAFVGEDNPDAPVRVTTLDPVSADLHYRGFSRMYRKGGRYGPHWFAYDDVSTESPWRRIEGSFTRFGDVRPLLDAPDDMYVIMAPGDEMTVHFDAASERALTGGWTRDFLLYTDGWIKDSDLNTAFGTSVGPLPFHRIKAYPYAPGESYPNDSTHQRYMRDYNSRTVTQR